ncbi:hypothetical protein Q3G72_023402 [Acer saccharum]|nr:hypothetical protein Q3G72_023402 [Acer saccharum]
MTTSFLKDGKHMERNIRCNILVGTDGAGSTVRKLAAVDLRGEKDLQKLVSVQFLATVFMFLKDTETPLKGGLGNGATTCRRFVHRMVSLDDVKLVKKAMINTELADMMKKNSLARWGNHIGYLLFPFTLALPLQFHSLCSSNASHGSSLSFPASPSPSYSRSLIEQIYSFKLPYSTSRTISTNENIAPNISRLMFPILEK